MRRTLGVRLPASLPPNLCTGRYPGSQVLMYRLPRLFRPVAFDTPTLAYRCGGSTGMMFLTRTCFPFNSCQAYKLQISPGNCTLHIVRCFEGSKAGHYNQPRTWTAEKTAANHRFPFFHKVLALRKGPIVHRRPPALLTLSCYLATRLLRATSSC